MPGRVVSWCMSICLGVCCLLLHAGLSSKPRQGGAYPSLRTGVRPLPSSAQVSFRKGQARKRNVLFQPFKSGFPLQRAASKGKIQELVLIKLFSDHLLSGRVRPDLFLSLRGLPPTPPPISRGWQLTLRFVTVPQLSPSKSSKRWRERKPPHALWKLWWSQLWRHLPQTDTRTW